MHVADAIPVFWFNISYMIYIYFFKDLYISQVVSFLFGQTPVTGGVIGGTTCLGKPPGLFKIHLLEYPIPLSSVRHILLCAMDLGNKFYPIWETTISLPSLG